MKPSKKDIVAMTCIGLIVGALAWAVTHRIVFVDSEHDYRVHITLSKQLLETRSIPTSHFLYHVLLSIVHTVIPGISFQTSAVLLTTLICAVTGIIIFLVLRASLGAEDSIRASVVVALASVAILFVSPITIFTWRHMNLYFGYIGLNAYHSPTIILLKPLVILLFIISLKAFSPTSERNRPAMIVLAGLLAVSSALVKPNYTLCLLPALGIVTLQRLHARKPIDWRLLTLGLIIPSIAVLGWQYAFTFNNVESPTGSAGIAFAPLQVMRVHSSSLGLKFMLSILFPLCVYIMYFGKARRNLKLNVAWVVFLFGALYMYLLAETGPRLAHGNFLWGAQVALLILFIISVGVLFEQNAGFFSMPRFKNLSLKLSVLGFVFGLHLTSGIYFYFRQIYNTEILQRWW